MHIGFYLILVFYLIFICLKCTMTRYNNYYSLTYKYRNNLPVLITGDFFMIFLHHLSLSTFGFVRGKKE